MIKKRVTFSTAAIVINTTKASTAIVSTFISRGSIDFCAVLGFISPPAVTTSRISGIYHAVWDFNIARTARSSERAGNEESSDQEEESLELLGHCFEGGGY